MGTIINGNDASVPGSLTVGTLKVTGGAPGAGKILVSDADGDLAYATPAAAAANFESGTYSIGNGVSDGSVTGLGLAFIPVMVIPVVRKPVGGFNLAVQIVDGTISADGFDFTLTGLTDSANYDLDFLLIKP